MTGARRRTCVGCRRTADAGELVRVSQAPDGTLRVGPGPGRGAWLCGPPAVRACLENAVRRRALDRALRAVVGDDGVRLLRAKLEG